MAPRWWFPCKPKHVGAVVPILKRFNNCTFFNIVCISWKLKCWIHIHVYLNLMYVMRITCQTSNRFCSYIPYKLKYSGSSSYPWCHCDKHRERDTGYQIHICDKLKSRHKESKFSKNVFVTYEYNMCFFYETTFTITNYT